MFDAHNPSPWTTNTWPFLCMAYRIPADTKLNMLLRIEYQNSNNVPTGRHAWNTVYLTEEQHYWRHPKAGSWAVVADDTWRYSCLDLQHLLDNSEDPNVLTGQDHRISEVIFWTFRQRVGSQVDNPFWIDEFAFSRTPRQMSRSEYPARTKADGSAATPLKLVDVKKVVSGDSRSWQVQVTSDQDCAVPRAHFEIDVSSLTGLDLAHVRKVQEHSEPLSGQVHVQLPSGALVSFSPYSTAEEVESAFLAANFPVTATRTGTCQSGFGWVLALTDSPGDQPLLHAFLDDKTRATINVLGYVDGGVLMGPISVDYMHRSTTNTNLQLVVNEQAADCAIDSQNVSRCLFSFEASLTPTLTSVDYVRTDVGTYSIIIHGSNFTSLGHVSSGSSIVVRVGALSSFECSITTSSDSRVECLLARPFLPAGQHPLAVNVAGKGLARGNLSITYELEISRVVPASLNRNIVNTVTIQGAGFDPTPQNNRLLVGGDKCEPVAVSPSALICTLGPIAESRRRSESSLQVSLQLDGYAASNDDLSHAPSSIPTISSVTPSFGALAGGFRVTIAGSLFSSTGSDASVEMGAGGTSCLIVESSPTAIVCTAGVGAIGVGPVVVSIKGGGVSHRLGSPEFEYHFSVNSSSPKDVSLGGGAQITCTGQGFSEDVGAAVAIAGRETYVVGLFVPSYIPEIHQLRLTADWENGYYLESNPPSGEYGLHLGNYTIGSLTPSASAGLVQELFSAVPHVGRVRVLKSREIMAGQLTDLWTITYLDLRGEQDLVSLSADTLQGGIITVSREQRGVALPPGKWQMKLGTRVSAALPLNATDDDVRNAVLSAFPDVKSATVFAVGKLPGQLIDREYPWQWAVKLVRQDLAGASRNRCINPLYVDWDPAACPQAAPDLFLNFYPWYWPSALPKPADLGAQNAKLDMLEACERESMANSFRPAACQALIPPESAPMCGQGSGIYPPCWTERFSTARVRHASDGQEFTYERDDSKLPSNAVKGYRFWKRPDLHRRLQEQMLTVNHSIPGSSGGGMDVRNVYQRAQELVACAAVSDVSYSGFKATAPRVEGISLSEMLRSDYFWTPRIVSFSPKEGYIGAQSGVTFVRSLTSDGYAARVGTGANAALAVPFFGLDNSERFTMEVWLRVNATGNRPILQVASQSSGFALLLTASGHFQFYLYVGTSQTATEDTQMPVAGFSIVSGPATIGKWTHVALHFDGSFQRLFTDATWFSSAVQGQYIRNHQGSIQFGGPCGEWTSGACGDAQPRMSEAILELDEVLLYRSAVPVSLVAEHSSLLAQTLHGEFKAVLKAGLHSKCSADCSLQLLASRTPRVLDVQPLVGWSGREIHVIGEGFALGEVSSVQLGRGTCDTITRVSDSRLICTARAPIGPQSVQSGPVHVVLSPVGASLSSASFEFVSTIESVSPSEGSRFGGTNVTLTGFGIVADAARLSVQVGGATCVILSAFHGSLICRSAELSQSALPLDGDSLQVSLSVDGFPALCRASSACIIAVTTAATPQLVSLDASPPGSLEPGAVKLGSTLIVTGTSLPTSGNLQVHVGESPCDIASRTSSEIACTIGSGSGGKPRLRVRFEVGLAGDLAAVCCVNVTYEVKISGVSPSNAVSAWGGAILTMHGYGFQSDMMSRNQILIGHQLSAKVLAASQNALVFQVPSLGTLPWPSVQDLTLSVQGVDAICEDGSASCKLLYQVGPVLGPLSITTPTLELIAAVSPNTGGTGTNMTITGTGFNGSHCSAHSVSIGSTVCEISSCSSTRLQCTLMGSQGGGTYPLRVSLSGQACQKCWFNNGRSQKKVVSPYTRYLIKVGTAVLMPQTDWQDNRQRAPQFSTLPCRKGAFRTQRP